MSLRLHDTATRAARPLEQRRAGHVAVCACGPALAEAPSVGQLRGAVAVDVLHRWLRASGLTVTLVRAVTDLDDGALHDAAHGDEAWWALAARQERSLERALDALQVLPSTAAPRVSGVVPAVVALTAQALERGHAYVSSGDVYLAVRSVPSYGALSGQSPDALRASDRDVAHGHTGSRRDPLDVALWRAARPGEPSWASPWGPGRPGGHVGCAAVAAEHLDGGPDLQVGALDLVFPHHEQERAAALAAGHEPARHWLHHAGVSVAGDQPAALDALLATVRPQVLRYALGAVHHRSPLVWSATTVQEAEAAYGRLETFVRNATAAVGQAPVDEALSKASWQEFAAALDDDLGVPQALAAVHAGVRAGNALLAARETDALAATLSVVRRMLAVLALDPVGQWPEAGGGDLRPVVDALVALAVEARADARARKDWAQADALRDRLGASGVVLEDTPDGVRWRLA